MAILKTTIAIRDAAFAENTAVMRGLAEDLHAKVFEVMQGRGRPATAMSHAASYCHATGCGPCSIPALAQLKELSSRFGGFLKSADLQRVFIRQPHIQGTTLGNPGEFAALLAAVAKHRLWPVIHTRYPLGAAREALGVLWAGQQFGKIILDIWTSHDAQLHAEHPTNEWLRVDHEQLPRDGLS